MEYFNGLLNSLGLVPAEWYTSMNGTQKAIFLGLSFLVLVQLIQNLLYLYVRWRDRNVVSIEKEDTELKKKFGEECHDILVNWVNEGKLTRMQYKSFCRILKSVFPNLFYGGIYSHRARAILRTRELKKTISQRLLSGFNVPTQGWLSFISRTQPGVNLPHRFQRRK